MLVKTIEHAGFCFGVRRAVDTALREAAEGKRPIYTLGPVVHNRQVTDALSERGIRILDSEAELENAEPGTVILRAHGVPKALEERIQSMGFTVVDAVCPFVKKIHRIVNERSRKGDHIVILGDPEHPEVQGIVGWCEGPYTVISEPEDLAYGTVPAGVPLTVVAQTTFNLKKFQIIVEIMQKAHYNADIAETVCNATALRQGETAELAAEADLMLVIGDPSSSNTRKLYEISSQRCSHTYFIQSVKDIHVTWFQDVKRVGITAGASTPNSIIEEVQNRVGEF